MRFVSLTGFEAFLLVLFTAGVILASYYLKARQRRVVVASLMLWRRTVDNAEGQAFWRRLRHILSMALAVIIGLLIALGIARPEIDALSGNTERVVIVMDTSPTMLTRTSDGRTRWEHALQSAGSLLASHGNAAIRVADTSGRIDSSFTKDRRALRQMIARMQPKVSTLRFPEVEPRNTQVLFVSDGASGLAAPAEAKRISVFEPAENVGITAFEILSPPAAPPSYEAYLEVRNYGQNAKLVDLVIAGPKQQIARKIPLEAGKSYRESFDLSQMDGGRIRAAIHSEGDAFAMDDVAYGYLPVQKKVRTLLVTRGNPSIEKVLKLDPLVDLSIATPDKFTSDTSGGANYDALIFDRFAPAKPPAQPSLIFGAQNVSWLPAATGVASRPAFKSWMEDHPVMQYVSLHEVSVEKAGQIDASKLTVLASSGVTPLIVASDASDHPKWIMLTFDLQASDFARHVGFPVFMDNALGWLKPQIPALYRSPGVVEVPLGNAQIQTMDGKPVTSLGRRGGTVFETDDPGLYVASQGDDRLYVAVNLANSGYSDINRGAGNDVRASGLARAVLQHELWFYMLAFAVFLVGAEWFMFHRSITQ